MYSLDSLEKQIPQSPSTSDKSGLYPQHALSSSNSNGRVAPLILIDQKRLVGFNENRVRHTLQQQHLL